MSPSTSSVDSTYTNGNSQLNLARRDSNPGQPPSPYQQSQLLAQQQLQHQQQQQQQQLQSGMVNMFPTAAGHQLDLNHLWQQVQELSAILAANRESTAGLVRRTDEIRHEIEQKSSLTNVPADFGLVVFCGRSLKQNRTDLGENGHLLREAANGELNGTQAADFEAENQALRNENADLRAENEDLLLLVQDYETVLEKVLEGLRVYAREHAASTINIHQTYTNQLQSERQQNAILRQNETESQTRLTTISKLLREAYKDEAAIEPDALIEELRYENEALKAALGLPRDEGVEGDSETV